MTTFLFIRHGETNDVDSALAGQIDTPLNQTGEIQAQTIAQPLSNLPIKKIFSSPLKRALGTAQPLCEKLNLSPEIELGFNQVHFGDWEGIPFETLVKLPEWKQFVEKPGTITPPNGESAAVVRERVYQTLLKKAELYPANSIIAVFTHGSIVRHAVSAAIGLPLVYFNHLTIAPASVSTIKIKNGAGKLLALNQQLPTQWI